MVDRQLAREAMARFPEKETDAFKLLSGGKALPKDLRDATSGKALFNLNDKCVKRKKAEFSMDWKTTAEDFFVRVPSDLRCFVSSSHL